VKSSGVQCGAGKLCGVHCSAEKLNRSEEYKWLFHKMINITVGVRSWIESESSFTSNFVAIKEVECQPRTKKEHEH
jgi:hypothetical protein